MKKNKARLWRWLYKLHRYIGIISSLVLLMLAFTGIALNHTDFLKLDQRFVVNKTILDWYGIFAPKPKRVFKITHAYLTQLHQQLYFNQQLLAKKITLLQGVVETHNFIVIALKDALLLVSKEGEIIEKIKKHTLERIGIDDNQFIYIQQAGTVFMSRDGLLSWELQLTPTIEWAQTSTLPVSIEITLQQQFRGHILPLERVLLDLHSGRFFGIIGVIVIDLCGVLLILLIISGCSLWLRHQLKRLFPQSKK